MTPSSWVERLVPVRQSSCLQDCSSVKPVPGEDGQLQA